MLEGRRSLREYRPSSDSSPQESFCTLRVTVGLVTASMELALTALILWLSAILDAVAFSLGCEDMEGGAGVTRGAGPVTGGGFPGVGSEGMSGDEGGKG